ncbi:hypothetical protein EC973_001612 [Apophysomyces ossiformis]|uniref:Autophagy-related protein 101 n=1 Tax=Apophysomyces ossiformis TaxID=679940 RepID=A0A8H7BWK2_9FUNG|nr:hypothetical protein EC973_001612 [Apophysomyces ossiformis]
MPVQAQEFNIEMVSVPRESIRDVLRALLHSIFFHRLLVNVAPRELRVLDTTVSITDSPDIEKLVEDRITEFLQNNSHVKQGKMAVLFYEKRLKKNWFQLSKSEELVCWEQWAITLGILHPQNDQERQKAQRSVERQLPLRLLDILKMANDHKEHIPSITTTEGNPFPYQIAIPSQSESWAAMIKRLVVTDAPTNENQRQTVSASPRSPSHLSSTDTQLDPHSC